MDLEAMPVLAGLIKYIDEYLMIKNISNSVTSYVFIHKNLLSGM